MLCGKCGGKVVKTSLTGEYQCASCLRKAAMDLSVMCITLTTQQSIREAKRNKTLTWIYKVD